MIVNLRESWDDPDQYIFQCDECGDYSDDDFDTFDGAVKAKSQTGWKSDMHNGEWRDLCPSCYKKLHSGNTDMVKQILLARRKK